MTSEGRELIEAYLGEDPRAVARVDRWIESAASSYYRTLRHEWDDVLQDLRLEILRELRKDRYRGEASIKTYLWRVVNHSCLDRVRAVRRWRWTSIEEEGPELEREAGSGAGPWAELETSDLLLRVLEQVGHECRKLWQRIVAGHSYREISRATGVSEGALRVRALRCRREALAIRERLGGEGREEV